jgi:hypothetical protein
LFDATLFAILAVRPTLLAVRTGIPHETLNRERKGGIVNFVAVGSETKQRRFDVTVVVAGSSRRRRDAAGGAKTKLG